MVSFQRMPNPVILMIDRQELLALHRHDYQKTSIRAGGSTRETLIMHKQPPKSKKRKAPKASASNTVPPTAVAEEDVHIACDVCNAWFLMHNTGLTREDADKLDFFECEQCQSSGARSEQQHLHQPPPWPHSLPQETAVRLIRSVLPTPAQRDSMHRLIGGLKYNTRPLDDGTSLATAVCPHSTTANTHRMGRSSSTTAKQTCTQSA